MYKSVFAACAALALGSAASEAGTITFDSNFAAPLSHGDFISAFDFGGGLTGSISVSGGVNLAQIYDTTTVGGRDPDLESPTNVAGPTEVLGNALIVAENRNTATPDDNARGGLITFMFDRLVRFSGVTLLDAERQNQFIRVTADGYDSGPQFNGDGLYSNLSFAPVTTKTITFEFGGSGAIDNLQVAAVPLPAPVLFLLTALGGMVLLPRRET